MPEHAQDPKTFYVTTPIYYVNDAPHIGHAYTTVAADVVTRWHRQRGERVWFLTGTDEHGEKVLRSAQEHDMTPQAWADSLVDGAWRPMLATLEVANDDFIRTTQERHTRRVQAFLQQLFDAGFIYEGDYEGPYCVSCEEFKLASELLEGPGGQALCPVHHRPVEMLAERNWFFRLSQFGPALLEHYADHPEAVAPTSARNEVLAFLRAGLEDLSISRSTFDWGIPVPWDPAQVVYVWFDALLNYATAVGLGDTDPAGAAMFAATWPADIHLVGKDILRFHAVIWPAMLMAAGLALPRQVFAHGWLLVGGEKMSKTRLTGIAPADIVDTFGADAFRWYFLRAIQFGADGSFSWEDLHARYTAELANGLGNLTSRVTAMLVRYCDGSVPVAEPGPAEVAVHEAMATALADADAAVEELRLADALAALYALVVATNGYLTEQQPWHVWRDVDTDPTARARVGTVLATAADALRALAVLLAAVMPSTAAAMWDSLGAHEALGPLADQRLADAARPGQLPAGTTVTKGEGLFPRIEESA